MGSPSSLQGIAYLEGLAPWSGSFAGEWSLELTRTLLKRLGDPHNQFPSVHVTGTNGKGSVSAAIASILAAGGRKVGLTTSPHLKRINERIVIDGSPISDDLLNECGEAIRQGAEGLPAQPTFFEGITAAAFVAFKRVGVDFGVVEVGLGGRLDATNVLNAPKACVVVTVDFDHEAILGSTLGAIAREKGGIIKSGAHIVVGRLHPEADEEISRAASIAGGKPIRYGTDFVVSTQGQSLCAFKGLGDDFTFNNPLNGEHQLHNMGVALATARRLGCSLEECSDGLSNLRWPGRLEICSWKGREVVIDAAHNPAGIESLIAFLKSRGMRPAIGFGAIETKNWREMVRSLVPYVGSWSILEPDFPKAVPAQEIVAFLSGFGISASNFGRDYRRFLDESGRGSGSLLIAGSIYLIGIIRDFIVLEEAPLWRVK